MDGFTVEVDSVAFESAMQRLKAGVRDGLINPIFGTLPKQASLLAKRCQDFTPPRNVGQGKAAVARDLSTIFRPLNQSTFTDKSVKKIVRRGDIQVWNKLSPNFSGSLKNTRAIVFDEKWHAQNRMSRGRGRRGKGNPPNIGVVTIGASASLARSYTTKVKKRVGWAKAGWNVGVFAGGAGVDPFSGIPQWIGRHGMGQGEYVNGMASADPFVLVRNSTSWARYGSQGEGNRILRNAIAARARDMELYAVRMAELAKAKAGV